MRALVLGLLAVIVASSVSAQPSDSEFQAWMAKPQVNFSKLGVTYWHVEEPWADGDAVVTIDGGDIAYSGPCDTVRFPYKQHWESEGQLEVFPAWASTTRCGGKVSEPFLRFYYFLRQSASVKDSGGFVAVGESLNVTPLIRLARFEPEGLEFRRWVIREYFDGDRLTAPDLHYPDYEHPSGPPLTMPPPTITFDRGELEGSPSCGGLVGDYSLEGQSLEIHPGFRLRGFCPPNLLHQNDRVLAALRRARHFGSEGAEMLLRGDKGEVEVVLARKMTPN